MINADIDRLTREISINPDKLETAEKYFNRGMLYEKYFSSDKSRADFLKALELNHDYAALYRDHGMTYILEGKCSLLTLRCVRLHLADFNA
jgi:tetratricopeptide (TPR) repeat protein